MNTRSMIKRQHFMVANSPTFQSQIYRSSYSIWYFFNKARYSSWKFFLIWWCFWFFTYEIVSDNCDIPKENSPYPFCRENFWYISPFVSIEPRKSKETELLQIVDILIGAIGFQKNGYDLHSDTRKSKKELVKFIAKEAGLKDLKQNSPWGNNRFTIWNFRLQK